MNLPYTLVPLRMTNESLSPEPAVGSLRHPDLRSWSQEGVLQIRVSVGQAAVVRAAADMST
jgi:hypothetical protein